MKQYQKIFEFENVELEFTVEALEAIATQAIKRATVARGRRAILEEALLGVMYDLPGRDDVAKVIVDADTVLEGAEPTLVTNKDERAAS